MILTVTLNPSLDQTLFLKGLKVGDTNRVEGVEMDAGGKGINLSRIALELDAKTLATGFLGGMQGAAIRSICDAVELKTAFVPISGETRSNIGIELSNGEPPTTLNARGPEIQINEWQALCATITQLIWDADWVCLCGSMPPGVPDDAYAILGQIAKDAGRKVLLDADGSALTHGLTVQPDLIKPNEHEAARLLGHPIEGVDQAMRAATELYESLGGGDRIAIISLGADGAVMRSSEGLFKGDSPDVEAVSTVGAGDSMLGGFLASLERGEAHAQALKWGLAAGAATATSDGTHLGRRTVIELLYTQARVTRLD